MLQAVDSASWRRSAVALAVVCAGFLLWLLPLGRYPSFYEDEVFFVLPALRGAAGHPFVYAVSAKAPFAEQAWGYHGPLFPRLLELLFHVAGYSVALTRLPNVVGAWLAVLLVVLFLARRGYGYAGVLLAVLWCGDRATQEVLYARMDGLALLWLVAAFLLLRRAMEPQSGSVAERMILCGVCCGLATLTNPMCVVFPLAIGALLVLTSRARLVWMLGVGLVLCGPLLCVLWGGPAQEAWAQFLWHSQYLSRRDQLLGSVVTMVRALRWSRYWVLALGLYGAGVGVWLGVGLWRRTLLEDGTSRDLAVAALFTVAALPCVIHRSTHPYYWVYFSLWPMLFLAITAERWPRRRVAVLALLVLPWMASAAWTGLRLREAYRYRRALGDGFLQQLVREDVPAGAGLLTTPRLYSVPLRAGRRDLVVTSWMPEGVDPCPGCFLLMTAEDFAHADFIDGGDLQRRAVRYAGPAFPGAGPLAYPMVLLGPQQ